MMAGMDGETTADALAAAERFGKAVRSAVGSPSLTEFLLARITEDEATILEGWDSDGRALIATMWTGPEPGYTTVASGNADGDWVAHGREVDDPRHVRILFDPARVLAECDAKRRIIEDAINQHTSCPELDWVVAVLALPYADHPDYREEWRP